MNRYHTHIVNRLESSAADLLDALGKLSDEQIHRVPEPGGWSIHGALVHVREVERVFLYRLTRVLDEDAPPAVENFDSELWQSTHYAADEPLKQIVNDFRKMRRALVKRLRASRDKDWLRYARHPEYGNITVEWLALHVYSHTLEHLHQLLTMHEDAVLDAANASHA